MDTLLTPWFTYPWVHNGANTMGLQQEIEKQGATIKSDSYKMSIGELVNLYRDQELDVHPEFQRVYRWKPKQKTRLIESILLGIPIPPIFVAQRKDGVWDVVDGVQRLSTIFQFMGELYDDSEPRKKIESLVLEGTDFLPSLAGKKWKDKENGFTRDQQLYIKRAKIDMNIVLKESDEKTKYELFMRLNTGGSILQPQEVRNCLLVMAYPETYKWLLKLSENEYFRKSVSLSDRQIEEKYHMELVNRFVLLRKFPETSLKEVKDIGDFLNERLGMLDELRKKQQAAEEEAFDITFKTIYECLGDDSFTKYHVAQGQFKGGFSISAFETIALGVGYNVNGGSNTFPSLKSKAQGIWSEDAFTHHSGSGVRASDRIPIIVPLGRKLFTHGEDN